MKGSQVTAVVNSRRKGINMPSLNPDHACPEHKRGNPGGDCAATGPNTGFARDAFGMILGYHEQDFVKSGSVYDSSHTTTSSWHVPNPTFLYNGNLVPSVCEGISSWAWNSRRASGATDTAMASVYHYDLLNRIRTDSTRLRGATAWSAVGSHWQSSYTYDGNGNIQTLYRANATGSQMDNLTYAYTSGTNKLINISDYQGASTGADIGNQGGNNYAYDATGNMTQDTAAGIEAGGIVWSPYNKIKSITKMGDDTTSKLVYHYDATGNRILKRYYKPYNTLKSTTWYVRDAQGNTLATYTKPADSSTARQHEVMLYGSTRIAVAETQAPYSDSETDTLGIFDRVSSRTLGKKRYELTDHLGNVRATVSDVVIDHSGDLDAELSTRTDYYPFGMIMGGRNSSSDDAHRYGFNGKENDNEVKGEGVQQDYGFRIYDARVARFLSVDPLTREYAALTPFQFSSNTPIWAVDLDGLEAIVYTETDDHLGHTFIEVLDENRTVWTYGRYAGTSSQVPGAQSLSPVGPGVLIKYQGEEATEYIRSRLEHHRATAYLIPAADADDINSFLQSRYDVGTMLPEDNKYHGEGRIIDTYNVLTNNCATLVINALKAGGFNLSEQSWPIQRPPLKSPAMVEGALQKIVNDDNSTPRSKVLPDIPKGEVQRVYDVTEDTENRVNEEANDND